MCGRNGQAGIYPPSTVFQAASQKTNWTCISKPIVWKNWSPKDPSRWPNFSPVFTFWWFPHGLFPTGLKQETFLPHHHHWQHWQRREVANKKVSPISCQLAFSKPAEASKARWLPPQTGPLGKCFFSHRNPDGWQECVHAYATRINVGNLPVINSACKNRAAVFTFASLLLYFLWCP